MGSFVPMTKCGRRYVVVKKYSRSKRLAVFFLLLLSAFDSSIIKPDTLNALKITRKERINMAYQFSEDSQEFLDSLAPEMKERVENALNKAFEENGIEGKIDLINVGTKSSPNVSIMSSPDLENAAEAKYYGELYLNYEGNLVTSIDDAHTIHIGEPAKVDIAPSLEKVSEKVGEALGAEPLTPEEIREAISSPEKQARDAAKEAYGKINDKLEEMGLDTSLNKKMEKNALKELKKDNKQQLRNIKQEINTLYKELVQELSIAQINGYSKESAERIDTIGKTIADKTEKAVQYEKATKADKTKVVDTIQDKLDSTRSAVSKGMDKVIAGYKAKQENGINALGKIKAAVKTANEKFSAQRDTAYTNLSEKVESIHRKYLQVDYSIDKMQHKALDKIDKTLTAAYTKQAEVKNAFKNLGRAILGKKQDLNADMKPKQKARLASIKGHKTAIEKRMRTTEKDFNLSKEISKANIRGAQEHRESVGLNRSQSLDEKLKEVHQRNIDSKAAKAKETKTQPAQDREAR